MCIVTFIVRLLIDLHAHLRLSCQEEETARLHPERVALILKTAQLERSNATLRSGQ